MLVHVDRPFSSVFPVPSACLHTCLPTMSAQFFQEDEGWYVYRIEDNGLNLYKAEFGNSLAIGADYLASRDPVEF